MSDGIQNIPEKDNIIKALEEGDPVLEEEIRKRMREIFVFKDIVQLDDRSIQKILREVDAPELAKALKGVDDEIKEKIFRNMTKRAVTIIREDMEFMGPIRLVDVEYAQHGIVNMIIKLRDAGEIVIVGAGQEEFVV